MLQTPQIPPPPHLGTALGRASPSGSAQPTPPGLRGLQGPVWLRPRGRAQPKLGAVNREVGEEGTLRLGAGVQSLGSEDPLEKKMATPSSIFAWSIPWKEEPGG